MTAFSDWVASAAQKRGLESQAEIARALDVAESMVGRWRTRGTVPEMATLRKVATGLHVPIQEALVAAGHVQPEEVGYIPIKLESVSDRELLAELARRLGEGEDDDGVVMAMGSAAPFDPVELERDPPRPSKRH